MLPPLVDCQDRIKHRFSARRLSAVVNGLSDTQKGFVKKYGFQKLLDIKWFSVPVPFLEWVMDHIIVDISQFVHKKKTIKFTKFMMKQVFDIPSGSTPVIFDSQNETVISEFLSLKACYCANGEDKASIAHVTSMLLLDENEQSFIRSFLLIVLSTVLCPSTQNFVNLNYLYNLIDVSLIKEVDWIGHAFSYTMSEVKRYQGKVSSDEMIDGSSFYFGGCLPFLAIVYMDFLDLHNPDLDHYHINYDLPRITNVATGDFNFVMSIDRNTLFLHRNAYGVINFRDISSTPYAFELADTVPLSQSSNIVSPAPGSSASKNLFHVDLSILPIVKKHCSMLSKEFTDEIAISKSMNNSLGNQMLPIFANRLSLLSAEVLSHALSNQQAATRIGRESMDQHIFHTPSQLNVPNENNSVHLSGHDGISAHSLNVSGNHGNSSHCHSVHLSGNDAITSSEFGIHTPIAFASPEVGSEDVESPKKLRGSSSINKRQRRKRHAISFTGEHNCIKLRVSKAVEQMYNTYIKKIFIKKSVHHESPLFVVMDGFHCTYERFRLSLKQHGDVSDDVMSLFAYQFNHDHKDFTADPLSRNKITFSPFFSYKLDWPVEEFEPEYLEAELTRINAAMPLSQADLLFFPMYKNDNWMLVVINTLYQEVNVLDPYNALPPKARDQTVSNLVENFQLLCKECQIFDRNFLKYRLVTPSYPKISSMFAHYRRDSGIFVMLYVEYWDGRVMKFFDHDDACVFREILVHRLITSPVNEIKDLKGVRDNAYK